MTYTDEVEAIRAKCEEVGLCWIWTGSTDGHGRPQKHRNGRTWYVRRLVRELVDGRKLPKGREAAATCGCALCVSPECSVSATPTQRAALAAARGSFSRPDKMARMIATKRAKSHISEELVQRIRDAEGPASRIARETSISLSHVKAIRRGTARRDWTKNPFAGLLAANDSTRRAA